MASTSPKGDHSRTGSVDSDNQQACSPTRVYCRCCNYILLEYPPIRCPECGLLNCQYEFEVSKHALVSALLCVASICLHSCVLATIAVPLRGWGIRASHVMPISICVLFLSVLVLVKGMRSILKARCRRHARIAVLLVAVVFVVAAVLELGYVAGYY